VSGIITGHNKKFALQALCKRVASVYTSMMYGFQSSPMFARGRFEGSLVQMTVQGLTGMLAVCERQLQGLLFC